MFNITWETKGYPVDTTIHIEVGKLRDETDATLGTPTVTDALVNVF
jgi:hypothetical protein